MMIVHQPAPKFMLRQLQILTALPPLRSRRAHKIRGNITVVMLCATSRRSQTSRARASSATTPRLPDAGLRNPPAGQTRDLPVPAQRASTHARVCDHAGSGGARNNAPVHVAFRDSDHVGARDYLAFAAQWLAYALPYRRFAIILADANARLGADAVCYSFIVVNLHHLLFAGFYRRTKQQVLALLGRAVSLGAVRHMETANRAAWVAWLFSAYLRAAPLPCGVMAEALSEIHGKDVLGEGGLIMEQSHYHKHRYKRASSKGKSRDLWGQRTFIAVCIFVFAKLAVTGVDWDLGWHSAWGLSFLANWGV